MEAGIIENCGKFSRVIPAGCYCLMWPWESYVNKLSLKVNFLDVICDTKTKDNVFVRVVVTVQYRVMPEKVPSAFYKLTDHESQIRSYVFDCVRSSIPRLELDEAFASKDDVANNIKNQLASLMDEYGYEILAALVVDLDPDNRVKFAMNDINASQRLREAAAEKAEAEKILQVKAAEAEAESKYLSGVGVAKQRKAIVGGLRDTVNTFSDEVDGAGPKDVMDLLLLTQYFDMIRDLGRVRENTLFLPHGPKTVEELRGDLAHVFALREKGK